MTKTIVVMSLAVVLGVVGDILLSKGMKEIGDASSMSLRTLFPFVGKVITCPKIMIGTAFLAGFFCLWLAVLSWEQLSVALPMQAVTFVLGPVLAQIWLGDSVSPIRWTGTVLISMGVVLVTLKS